MFHVEQVGHLKSELLKKIASLQLQKDNLQYPSGLFTSQRFLPILKYCREDNNVFCSASIAFVLSEIIHHFSQQEQLIIRSIHDKVCVNYPLYKNNMGGLTYNYWQTTPSKHFPNGKLLHRFRHFQIPDDIDVTSLIGLTTNQKKETIYELKMRLEAGANLSQKNVTVIHPRYRNLKAYSTFFVDKMPLELDFAVLCNTLTWVFKSGLQLSEQDIDSLLYLSICISSGDFWNKPKEISMSYPTTPLLLYHLARLMYSQKIDLLEAHKHNLIEKASNLLQETNNVLEKTLISSSLLKWGERPQWTFSRETRFNHTEYFYVANMVAPFGNYALNKLFPTKLFIKYRCEALNMTLALENICLANC